MSDSIKNVDYATIEKRAICLELGIPLDCEDVHRAYASKLYGVSYEEVTPLQRRAAKGRLFLSMYGGRRGL